MGLFRRKHHLVEAVQWSPGVAHGGVGVETTSVSEKFYVTTAHGQRVYLTPGDWILPEPTAVGLFYPVKPDAFVKMYDPEDPF